ncbi:hypothetical protein BU26DRAFT_413835 [Trematosphaeria pertusa]|uniref:Uncharacterized protein n=1 Tax=Trematosphaeria pertusa TaxID=390896 RepID=A0A6A6J330_9PLEO|nr:uncharacterized protein BU26DRAFT_413835 [Trematosphaeria pertusa]KAF2256622.1 hypothetical protein BU26DRAFT_413835 [Trematosphaeria pertusa]
MGGRLSMPRGPDGMNEVSKPTSGSASARFTRGRGIINGRTVMAPLAALTMAGLLFVYARTSIRAAKLNAQKHREADGGQISWHKESLRRHGQLERVENDRSTLKEAFMADVSRKKKEKTGVEEGKIRAERSAEEERLRKMMGKDD